MTTIERKNVLDLFPYFSKYPVIFDVGSNKGQWSDVLVNNVTEIHLFEPNELLLHYTMVKYDYARNVKYRNEVVYKNCDDKVFYYFTNENNGLSNIYNNEKWMDLAKDFKGSRVARCISLDMYSLLNKNIDCIDFLKIDVEGAEMEVLKGAKNLLNDKRIKFIQVEKADHILLSGYTFDDLVKYLSNKGYVPMQTQDTENVIFMQEGFTQDWNGEFKKNTQGLKFDFALEIGSFEGLTSRYICDNLLNPGGRVICVDPLTDEYLPGHKDNQMFVGQYERFTRNTRGYPIELIRKQSKDAYSQLEDYRFDFVYIDGDHTRDAVFIDGCNAFRLTKVGGHILFDDYEWRQETKEGINNFLNAHQGKYITKVRGYQILIQKTEN
jgi:FkbM family methyltransferase